mmetsp:Transcript_28937/g.93291  ORF Transcript_28937/g.93291 Transcript_28937/m.93291 type:complete len:351 (+) Transcript_28937:381-1433(+)
MMAKPSSMAALSRAFLAARSASMGANLWRSACLASRTASRARATKRRRGAFCDSPGPMGSSSLSRQAMTSSISRMEAYSSIAALALDLYAASSTTGIRASFCFRADNGGASSSSPYRDDDVAPSKSVDRGDASSDWGDKSSDDGGDTSSAAAALPLPPSAFGGACFFFFFFFASFSLSLEEEEESLSLSLSLSLEEASFLEDDDDDEDFFFLSTLALFEELRDAKAPKAPPWDWEEDDWEPPSAEAALAEMSEGCRLETSPPPPPPPTVSQPSSVTTLSTFGSRTLDGFLPALMSASRWMSRWISAMVFASSTFLRGTQSFSLRSQRSRRVKRMRTASLSDFARRLSCLK